MGNEKVGILMSTDWHLKRENLAEVIDLVDGQLMLANDLGFKQIFVLGDIFDSRVSQRIEVLDAFFTILNNAKDYKIVINMIPGNHDKTDYKSTRSFLRYFKNHPYLNLIETYGMFFLGNLQINMLPYFDKDSDEWHKNLKAIIKNQKDGYEQLLLSHCSVVGSINNDGSSVTDGVKISSLKSFKYVFLGHYHNKQHPSKNVWHIPSIRQNNFGEDEQKGFTIFWADGEQELIKSDFTRYKKVTVDLSKLDYKEVMKLADEYKEQTEDNKIRFEIIGNEAEVQSFDTGYLNELGIDVKKKRVDLVPQEEDIEITDELFIYSAEDILNKFAEFCGEQGLDLDEGVVILKKIII